MSVGDVIEKGPARGAHPPGRPASARSRTTVAKLTPCARSKRTRSRSPTQQSRLRARDLAQQRANLERSIETLEKDIALLRERLEAERSLLDDGLITKQAFLTTQQSLNSKRDELAAPAAGAERPGAQAPGGRPAARPAARGAPDRASATWSSEMRRARRPAGGERQRPLPLGGRVLEVRGRPRRRGEPRRAAAQPWRCSPRI